MIIQHGTIFEKTIEAFESIDLKNKQNKQDKGGCVIHRGGTSSAKTYEIMLYILSQALLIKQIFTIVSESVPHLDIGAIRYLKEQINNNNLHSFVKFNESSRKVLFTSGSIIEFFSADRIDKALGARRYMLYCNEVNSLKYSVVDELARRSKYIIFDFNPTAQFWLEDKFLPYYAPYEIIKSNYLDNPFCPAHEAQRVEKRASLDKNFHRVHILGEYGNVEGLVFRPEQITLIDEFPKDLRFTYGLDFGFVAPSCLVKVGETDDSVYIDEKFYRSGMNTQQLIDEIAKINE